MIFSFLQVVQCYSYPFKFHSLFQENELTRIHGNHVILLYMNSPVKRYIYEEAKNGTVFRMGRYHLVCSDEELQIYQNWKDKIDTEKHCFEELSPPFRRYLKEFPDQVACLHYMGEKWVKMTHDHNSEYNDWLDMLGFSIAENS